jgi:hypothetical protein
MNSFFFFSVRQTNAANTGRARANAHRPRKQALKKVRPLLPPLLNGTICASTADVAHQKGGKAVESARFPLWHDSKPEGTCGSSRSLRPEPLSPLWIDRNHGSCVVSYVWVLKVENLRMPKLPPAPFPRTMFLNKSELRVVAMGGICKNEVRLNIYDVADLPGDSALINKKINKNKKKPRSGSWGWAPGKRMATGKVPYRLRLPSCQRVAQRNTNEDPPSW